MPLAAVASQHAVAPPIARQAPIPIDTDGDGIPGAGAASGQRLVVSERGNALAARLPQNRCAKRSSVQFDTSAQAVVVRLPSHQAVAIHTTF